MIKWLKENYNASVVACIVDVGRPMINYRIFTEKALKTSAQKAYTIDAKKEFVEKIHLSGNKVECGLRGKVFSRDFACKTVNRRKGHRYCQKGKSGCRCPRLNGKGNDQVRFELTFKALMPSVKIIAPWREWKIKSRQEEINYAKKHGNPGAGFKEKTVFQ